MNNDAESNFKRKMHSYLEKQANILNYIISANLMSKINETNMDGNTILHWACTYDLINIAAYYISNGADVNIYNNNGCTPLHLASANGHLIIIDLLENAGANKNAIDNEGRIPLQCFMEYTIGNFTYGI
jgi:ankyrin repeat protein